MSLNSYKRIIEDAFDSENWNYSSKKISEEKYLFSIDFISKTYGETCCKIRIYESGICDMEAVLPVVCEKEQHMELGYYLVQYNCLKRYSTLRLDTNDGEVINRYSFVFNQSTTPEQFLQLFLNVKDIEDLVMNDLISICNKKKPVAKSEVSYESQSVGDGKKGKHKLSL